MVKGKTQENEKRRVGHMASEDRWDTRVQGFFFLIYIYLYIIIIIFRMSRG